MLKPEGPSHAALAGAHWRFAVDFYARPGISEACLLLQDRIGVDVPILLFALFLAKEHGIVLEQGDLARLDGLVRAWRDEVIWPLRRVRRRLKSGPYPAPGKASAPLLQQLQGAEILAEQIELATLALAFEAKSGAGRWAGNEGALVLGRVSQFFATRANVIDALASPEIGAALERIAEALARPSAT